MYDSYVYLVKLKRVIDKIENDAYSKPVAEMVALVERYSWNLYEEVLDKGDIVNANIAYDIFMNVHRVLDVILNEEDDINSVKLFVSAISSYLADNWNQSTAA